MSFPLPLSLCHHLLLLLPHVLLHRSTTHVSAIENGSNNNRERYLNNTVDELSSTPPEKLLTSLCLAATTVSSSIHLTLSLSVRQPFSPLHLTSFVFSRGRKWEIRGDGTREGGTKRDWYWAKPWGFWSGVIIPQNRSLHLLMYQPMIGGCKQGRTTWPLRKATD